MVLPHQGLPSKMKALNPSLLTHMIYGAITDSLWDGDKTEQPAVFILLRWFLAMLENPKFPRV